MLLNKVTICFLSDKHSLYDDRIYWKMAVPLKQKGVKVHYLLITNNNEEGITNEGIHFISLKLKSFSKNRYLNFILKNINPNNNYKKLLKEAKIIHADIYHFHDLWINKIGKKLKKLPHKPVVFYDAREPYSEDYISYSKLKWPLNLGIKLFAKWVNKWEKNCAKNYDLVISNEETVQHNFRKALGKNKAEVLYNYTNNYTLYSNTPIEEKKYDLIYCGGITEHRGAYKIIEAVKIAKKTIPNINVVLVGNYSPVNFKNQLQQVVNNANLQSNIALHNFVNYSTISKYYNTSKIGLITVLPIQSFKTKMFIKLFEYMAFGLPIVGSNFGKINEYITAENVGITVNPLNENEIANAIVELLTNHKKYELYSKNGRIATLQKYKWETEFEKLLGFYKNALEKRNQ